MAEQGPQPLHDGKTEAKTAAAFTRSIVELVILLENRLKLGFGDADAGVPDFDAQRSVVPPTAQQNLAALRVFHGVR